MELAGLLHRPELDLDAPTDRVELVDLVGIDPVVPDVGDDETPPVLDETPLCGGHTSSLCIPVSSATVLLRLLGRQACCDEATAMSPVPPDPQIHVEALRGGFPEDLVEISSFPVEAGQAGGQSTDPERLAAFDLLESVQREVAPVPHHKVTGPAFRRQVEPDGLIGVACIVKAGTDGASGEPIRDEVDLAPRRLDLPVPIVGEVMGVALCHGDHRRVLDENPLEKRFGRRGLHLAKQMVHHPDEELRGSRRKPFGHPLTGHGANLEPGLRRGEMLEGGSASGGALDECEEKTFGRELVGMPPDKAGNSCESFEF